MPLSALMFVGAGVGSLSFFGVGASATIGVDGGLMRVLVVVGIDIAVGVGVGLVLVLACCWCWTGVCACANAAIGHVV